MLGFLLSSCSFSHSHETSGEHIVASCRKSSAGWLGSEEVRHPVSGHVTVTFINSMFAELAPSAWASDSQNAFIVLQLHQLYLHYIIQSCVRGHYNNKQGSLCSLSILQASVTGKREYILNRTFVDLVRSLISKIYKQTLVFLGFIVC